MKKLIVKSLMKKGVIAVCISKRGIIEITRENINSPLPKRGNLYTTLVGLTNVVCLQPDLKFGLITDDFPEPSYRDGFYFFWIKLNEMVV